MRNRAPCNYRVALTRLQQTEVHTAQKTQQAKNKDLAFISVGATAPLGGAVYSRDEEQSRQLGRRKTSCETHKH